jgi:hydroxyethylthiazole kinase
MAMRFSQQAAQNLAAIREKKPLVHNITNSVVMNFTANAILAMGALPVMADAENEVEEIVAVADALVLNIGTLTEGRIGSMIKAAQKASEQRTPIVFDPVGVGATRFRTETAKNIIDTTPISVIRGNASEILSLRHKASQPKGVASAHTVDEATPTAKIIAKELNTIVAITGHVDMVTDGLREIRISNGHPLMSYLTGTGCASSAAIGAFLAVENDALRATAMALAFFGIAGEAASKNASAPGTFMGCLIDALYAITPEDLRRGCRIDLS